MQLTFNQIYFYPLKNCEKMVKKDLFLSIKNVIIYNLI